MRGEIFHSFAAESIEEKARWFHSLTIAERLEIVCAWTDVILAINPGILETKKCSTCCWTYSSFNQRSAVNP